MVRLRFFACFVLLCVNFACLPKRRAHAAAFAAVAREAASFAVLHAMGSLSYVVFDVAPSLRDPCQGAASACSRGRLEATAAVLTGAASIWTTEIWSMLRGG